MKTLPLVALILALGLAAPAALAQTPLDSDPLDDHSAKRLDRMEDVLREMRAIVFQGRETGKPVVVEPADTDAEIATLSQKIDALQQAVTQLTGQLETASHDVDQAHHEADGLREENGALTARVAALETKLTEMAAAQAPPPPPQADTGQTSQAGQPEPTMQLPAQDPAAAMAAARQAYGAGDYAGAEADFRDIVSRYGDTPRGPEARYYLGKILLGRQAYADAAAMDLNVVRQWPDTSWAPDAALDLAKAMVGMQEAREACGVLTQIDAHYPKAGAAVRTGEADVRGQANCTAG